MFGIEFFEVITLSRQLGLAICGAASLWGMVFLYKSKDNFSKQISNKLFVLFLIGFFLTAFSWLVITETQGVALAHEGIVINAQKGQELSAIESFYPLFKVWIFVTSISILFKIFKKDEFEKKLKHFYLFEFVLIFVLISFPVWTGSFSREQFFFIGHNFHSIFTVGTVIVLDFLYVISMSNYGLKKRLFPVFSQISKVIWIGLGFDFLSVYLVFDQAINLTPKFFFMQTVIGIIIINGTFLSGPIARKMNDALKNNKGVLSKKWMRIASVSGVFSIGSWTIITVLDFFKSLTLQYNQLIGVYITWLVVIYVSETFIEKNNKKIVRFFKKNKSNRI